MDQLICSEARISLKKIKKDSKMLLPAHIREVFAKSTCLYSKTAVETALDRMASDMTNLLEDANPILLCVVVGGIVPLGCLLPRLNFPLEVDYIHATRYQNNMIGRELTWLATPTCDMRGRTVLVVDDILDGGVTLREIMQYCEDHGATEIYSSALVDKSQARLSGGLARADFTGLEVGNHYVFGYGMDYKGYLRNAPGIYVVPPEF